jgi:hypothetical protein
MSRSQQYTVGDRVINIRDYRRGTVESVRADLDFNLDFIQKWEIKWIEQAKWKEEAITRVVFDDGTAYQIHESTLNFVIRPLSVLEELSEL